MELAIILGLVVSVFLSLMFIASRATTNENDIVDLAAAEAIDDEYLRQFIRNRIMAGKLMRGSSYIIMICMLYITYIHFWS